MKKSYNYYEVLIPCKVTVVAEDEEEARDDVCEMVCTEKPSHFFDYENIKVKLTEKNVDRNGFKIGEEK